MLENLKLTLVQEWTESKVGKKKDAKTMSLVDEEFITTLTHRDKVGSVKIDFCVSAEALNKLLEVIHEDVFEHDAVKIEISATSSNV
mgnify:CR=1 FL=1